MYTDLEHLQLLEKLFQISGPYDVCKLIEFLINQFLENILQIYLGKSPLIALKTNTPTKYTWSIYIHNIMFIKWMCCMRKKIQGWLLF